MVRLSRRNVTALAGTFLASTAIRDKVQARPDHRIKPKALNSVWASIFI